MALSGVALILAGILAAIVLGRTPFNLHHNPHRGARGHRGGPVGTADASANDSGNDSGDNGWESDDAWDSDVGADDDVPHPAGRPPPPPPPPPASAKASARRRPCPRPPNTCRHLNVTYRGSNAFVRRWRCNDCGHVEVTRRTPVVGASSSGAAHS